MSRLFLNQFRSARLSGLRAGYTLVELLVVIGMIAVLASASLVGLTAARVRARDDRRVTDLKLIQSALEVYYQKTIQSGTIGQYPYPLGTNQALYDNNLLSQEIAEIPRDPLRKYKNGAEQGMSLRYIYYAPGCIHSDSGTNDRAIVSQPSSVNYLSAAEITGATSSNQVCPTGSGWVPYVLYGLLEKDRPVALQQTQFTSLAGQNQRALIYSVRKPIFKAGDLGTSQTTISTSYCYPATAACLTGFEE